MARSVELLAQVVGSADRVLLIVGPDYDARHREMSEVLAEERDRESIDGLVIALDTLDADAMDWTTPGGPSLVFLEDRAVLATVACVLPDYVRCPALWAGDRKLLHPDRLAAWLSQHGQPPGR